MTGLLVLLGGLLLIAVLVLAFLLWGGAIRLERAHRRNTTDWRISVETSGAVLLVQIVREESGIVTGRLLVERILSTAANWPERYAAAVAEASRRVDALRATPDTVLEACMDADNDPDARVGKAARP